MTTNQLLEQLQDQGFDASYAIGRDDLGRFTKAIRIKCSQCKALSINGVACHEQRCPNIPHHVDDDEPEWDPMYDDEPDVE